MRIISLKRDTFETKIELKINLDGDGISNIDTGIGFLDHMLTLFSFHSKFDLDIKCVGDTYVDSHHTTEDIGILLGEVFLQALGDRKGIERYASLQLPMDESLISVAVDICGRDTLVYKDLTTREKLGDLAIEDVVEFFKGFVRKSQLALHINVLYGDNDHHKIEGIFKGFGRGLKQAVKIVDDRVVSTKGVL